MVKEDIQSLKKKKKLNVQSNLNNPTTLSLTHTHTHTHTRILSAILGFPKLKIIFNLTNGLHIGRIVY